MLLLKSLLRTLVLPPAGPLLLALLGLLLMGRHRLLGRALIIVSLASLWLLSTPIISDSLTALTEHFGPLDLSQETGAGAIVILGGGGQITLAPEYGAPAAQTILLEKVTYGAYVAKKTGLPILVTGTGIEAIAMRETLARNFDTTVHWTEDQAFDTFENARNTAAILQPLGIRRIILITLNTHMWRSSKEFEAVGFDVVPAPEGMLTRRGHGAPAQFVPNAEALLESSLAVYELLGEPVRRFFVLTHLRRHLP